MPLDAIEHDCGGRFRPDIVWFGENLPQIPWEGALAAASHAELMLVIGTSGLVQPAASLASRRAAPSAWIVEINPEETAVSANADAVMRGRAAELLPQIVD
jgi:NAD-dependent deacetylase